MTVRGLDPSLRSYNIRDFLVTGRKANLAGRSCVELIRQGPAGRSADRLWVDPGREYVIARFQHTERETPTEQIDVRYRSNQQCGWVPESWSVVWSAPDGKLRESSRETVTQYQINEEVSPEEFDIVFPPGAWISDLKTDLDYIVKPGGGKRMINRDEMVAPYELLLQTETGEAAPPSNRPTFWTKWRWTAIGFAVAAAGLLFWRRSWRTTLLESG
jgi:hypothetical protein